MEAENEKEHCPAVYISAKHVILESDSKYSSCSLGIIFAYTLIACLGTFANGMILGYTAATLAELNNTRTGPDGYNLPLSSEYSRTFGTVLRIGALVGSLVAGLLSDWFGRKASIILAALPFIIGWYFITFAHTLPNQDGFITVLEVGQFIVGLGTGWTSICVPVYVAEISPKEWKGFFGSFQQLFSSLGIFLVEILGYITTFKPADFRYYHVSLIAMAIVLVFLCLMLLTKETPRWLLAHHTEEEAKAVLFFLRKKQEIVDKEFQEMTDIVKPQPKRTLKDKICQFKQQAVFYPVLLVLGVVALQQLTGFTILISYGLIVFQRSNVTQAALVVTFVVGLSQSLFTLLGSFLVDKMGRKILLVIGAIVLAISNILIAISDILTDRQQRNSNFSYMALSGFVLFMIAYSLSWGPVPWVIMAEMNPQSVRGFASGLARALNWLMAGVILYFDRPDNRSSAPYWVFAGFMGISIPFVVILFPETKGQSLESIEKLFRGGCRNIIRNNCRRKSKIKKDDKHVIEHALQETI